MVARTPIAIEFAAAAVAPPVVRTRVDWDRLASECAATLELYTETVELVRWFTPWYVNSAGERCEIACPEARQVPIAAVHATPGVLRDRDRERIAALTAVFSSGRLIEIATVTYGWEEGTRVVLDGNHRLIAASACPGRAVRLTNIALTGPCDPTLVADCHLWVRR